VTEDGFSRCKARRIASLHLNIARGRHYDTTRWYDRKSAPESIALNDANSPGRMSSVLYGQPIRLN